MDKLLEKISSYHFLNTLIPGACIAYLSNHFFGIDFLTEELLYNILIIFILGLISGRIGSVIIEPILKKTKIVCFEEYNSYLKASKKDEKMQELVTDNNLYRAMIAAFTFLFVEKLYLFLAEKWILFQEYGYIVILIFIIILYVLSYRKQTNTISKRIKYVLSKEKK